MDVLGGIFGGSLAVPKYPVTPVLTHDPPDQDRQKWFQGELDKLSSEYPTGSKDMPRYRIVWGGKRTRFYCGYTTMRYRFSLTIRQVGWTVHARDVKKTLQFDNKTGRPRLIELPVDKDSWTPEQQALYGKDIHIPAKTIFDVGVQNYYVEEWIPPTVACAGWDDIRYAYTPAGLRVDVLGPKPALGAYVPILQIADARQHGLYAPPHQGHLDFIVEAHKARGDDPRYDPQDVEGSAKKLHVYFLEKYLAAYDAMIEKESRQMRENIGGIIDQNVIAAKRASSSAGPVAQSSNIPKFRAVITPAEAARVASAEVLTAEQVKK